MKVKTEEKLVTAKADEVKTVKAIEKTLQVVRVEKEKQVDKKTETEASVTLPPHFATTLNISILTFTIFIFIFAFISVFDPFVSDHHFQTFTRGDLSDCKGPYTLTQTNSAQIKTTVNTFANPDSIRLFKVPETQPDTHTLEAYPGTPLFQNNYSQVKSGNLKRSVTTTHSYSIT
jgi:hypothetical protein